VTLARAAVLATIGLAAAVAFGTSAAPKEMESVSDTMRRVDYGGLPSFSGFTARDGATLSYRAYPHGGERAVVLIHGSSGESTGMHALARGVAEAGFAVYVPELRGHGIDGRLGDIDYAGQLDDDLEDLMNVVLREQPRAEVSLVGHSSGGGFALRIAEGPLSRFFSRYVLLAPALHYGARTWRSGAGGWARPFTPRIAALGILDRIGVKRFEHLPVVAFAVPRDAPVRLAPTYSFVMQRSFCAPRDDLERLGSVRAPIVLLVGEVDEIFHADRFAELLGPLRPGMPIEVLPGVDHMGLVTRPEAIAAAVAALGGPAPDPPEGQRESP
jgi:alpha-beta hydrolase superfamily lysophospholipase